jgi:hypothetical protein
LLKLQAKWLNPFSSASSKTINEPVVPLTAVAANANQGSSIERWNRMNMLSAAKVQQYTAIDRCSLMTEGNATCAIARINAFVVRACLDACLPRMERERILRAGRAAIVAVTQMGVIHEPAAHA